MLRWGKSLIGGVLLFLLASALACSRQSVTVASDQRGSNPPSQLPFKQTSEGSGISPTADLTSTTVPAGAEFVVSLQSPLSSADSRVGDRFDGVLDEPIMVQEHTLAEVGAPVKGGVVAVEPARSGQNSGYLRLTLVTITIKGRSFPLETSSMFAKGKSEDERRFQPQSGTAFVHSGTARSSGPEKDVRFSTGHRLLFRLAQPLSIHD